MVAASRRTSPDPQLRERQAKLHAAFDADFPFYSAKCLHIRTKAGEILPFTLNKAQQYIHERAQKQLRDRGYIRIILLKGRQQGASTYIEGRFMWKVSRRRGVKAFILTHEQAATDNLFEMTERYHEYLPTMVKPRIGTSNAKELSFVDLNSAYKIGTAGNRGAGRSSTLQYLHGSEVAFWPHAEEHAAGLMQAIPKGADAVGTEIFLESTANGIGNYFHEQWVKAEKGESDFEAVFVPWYWDPGYRLDREITLDDEELEHAQLYGLDMQQMAWRREKIAELGKELFKQEYPVTPEEAFRAAADAAFIDGNLIARARKNRVDPFGAPLLGVDVARFGDDATTFAFREGRKVHWVKRRLKYSTMDTVGEVIQLHRQVRFKRIFVDVIGVGAGVVDRLRELGLGNIVVAVNSSERALDDKRWHNKRTEMWGELLEWLKDEPVQIPDSDSLAGDIGAVQYKFDSNGRYQLEKKEDMKKRLLRSPDEGDAVALTFAEPVPMGDGAISYEPGEEDFLMGGEYYEPEYD
jgi:hypothetical protein